MIPKNKIQDPFQAMQVKVMQLPDHPVEKAYAAS